jgi:iron(III) transport system substrate-binding protein
MTTSRFHLTAVCATLLITGLLAGCKPQPEPRSEPVAVLYTSVDETFAREVIARYESRTGRKVELVTDAEAGKTTGLVKRIRLEKDQPRADVFWSSENIQTILLGREGLLAPYDSPAAADIPAEFKDPAHLWTGLALRARVVGFNPEKLPEGDRPKTWEDFAKPEYATRTTLANPLFGTTRTHVAALLALWGEDRLRTFLQDLERGGVFVADSNGATVRRIIAGDAVWAWTDSDDVIVAQRRGHKMEMSYPDMGDGGTLLIPTTVALLARAPHPDAGKHLIDFLVSAEVEEMLARSDSGNYPVRVKLREQLGIALPPANPLKPERIADAMDRAVEICREILLD